MAEKNLFELLRDKSILILDGDVDFDEIETIDSKGNIKISMPYLSGPILCDISNAHTKYFFSCSQPRPYLMRSDSINETLP